MGDRPGTRASDRTGFLAPLRNSMLILGLFSWETFARRSPATSPAAPEEDL